MESKTTAHKEDVTLCSTPAWQRCGNSEKVDEDASEHDKDDDDDDDDDEDNDDDDEHSKIWQKQQHCARPGTRP